ncbi:MAG TPA: efflux RND transporter permease subunit [Acidobacteriota bacterium]|nr:efflux RND transporter permease subunit [Acidobacteriota bacterium]|tara:strand:- start:3888 stop:7040 length:3153 start_codon:yes stop_codon:yes gene_type:complete
MKSVGRWSVDNRVPVNILMVLLIVGGVFAFSGTRREVFPIFTMKMVSVVTPYFGVSPAELEQLVTIPIENAVAEVSDVKEIRSTTSEGLSVVIIEFEEYIGNITVAAQDVESAINRITTLPDNAEETVVQEFELNFPIIDVAVAGTAPERERREIAKTLKRQLERIDGVSSVTATGLREREIWVEIDPNRLYGLNVSLDLVLARLRQRLVNVPAGSLQTERGEVLLRTSGTTSEASRVESVAVRMDDGGQYIRVADLGRVSDTFEEAVTLAHANGQQAINLRVIKQENGDTIGIVNDVRAMVADMTKSVPEEINFVLLNDSSVDIRNRLRAMYQSGIWGLALVLLVLNMFLNPRVAAMTAFGLPLAISGGLIMLYLSGGSLNILSMFAFILILGILVDDAIIVAENAYRYMQRGIEPEEAAVTGTRQVTIPVVAGVSTTIAAFTPLLLTAGVMGQFLKIVPIVAISCLLASLIESLVILPSHIADFCRPAADAKEARRNPLWFRKTRRRYGWVLGKAVRYRYLTFTLTIAMAIAAGAIASQMRFVFFDDSDALEFTIEIKGPPSNSLEDTERLVRQVESVILAFPPNEVESAVGTIGYTERAGQGRREDGLYLAQIRTKIPGSAIRTRAGNDIFRELRTKIQNTVVGAESIELSKIVGGPPVGDAIYVQILGEDIDVLREISAEIQGYLRGVNGVYDITDSFTAGKDEVQVQVDEARASVFGLSVDSIGQTIRTATDGNIVATVQEEDENIDVRVRYLPEHRRTADDIATLRIPTPTGDLVPFGNVATLVTSAGLGQIDRSDRERVIAVIADVDADIVTSIEANTMIENQFADLSSRYPGYHLAFGGEASDTTESLTSLFQAFIVAILVMYSILGAIFKSFTQPLVVLFAIPLSLIGVVFGFFIIGKPLTFMALFGVIALGGIVVNDSLLLVHFINEMRAKGINRIQAVALSAKRRFRPIMLTSLSTIAGVFPLTLVSDQQSAWLSPMAYAIVWGLSCSTFLILLLVPALYLINDDIQRGFKRLLGGKQKHREEDKHETVPAPALFTETS